MKFPFLEEMLLAPLPEGHEDAEELTTLVEVTTPIRSVPTRLASAWVATSGACWAAATSLRHSSANSRVSGSVIFRPLRSKSRTPSRRSS